MMASWRALSVGVTQNSCRKHMEVVGACYYDPLLFSSNRDLVRNAIRETTKDEAHQYLQQKMVWMVLCSVFALTDDRGPDKLKGTVKIEPALILYVIN